MTPSHVQAVGGAGVEAAAPHGGPPSSSYATAAGPIPFGALSSGAAGGEGNDAEAAVEFGAALAALAAAGGQALGAGGGLPRQTAANVRSLLETFRILVRWGAVGAKQQRGVSYLMSEACPGERSYVGLLRVAGARGGVPG